MNNKINFDFVSPEASIVSSEVDMVLIPGIDGDAGILPDHAPFMTTLRQGIVEVTFEQGNVKKYLVEGGFADITQDKMTILAETSLNLSDTDSKVLKSELDIINEKLASAEEDEKVLLDERKSLIENFIFIIPRFGHNLLH